MAQTNMSPDQSLRRTTGKHGADVAGGEWGVAADEVWRGVAEGRVRFWVAHEEVEHEWGRVGVALVGYADGPKDGQVVDVEGFWGRDGDVVERCGCGRGGARDLTGRDGCACAAIIGEGAVIKC